MLPILLLGAALRITPLTDSRLHPDEALFATLARLIVEGRDPWLAHTHLLVDKPPLFYYTLAAGVALSWAHEMSTRLPGLFASMIGIALAARVAWNVWASRAASWLTALFVALSPLAIAFAPTAFADPLMAMWLLAALVMISARRWGWAGLGYGLALATKQNALFFAPLVAGIGLIQSVTLRTRWRDCSGWAARFGVGVGLCVVLMVAWEAVRHTGDGFWAAGIEANNPGRLIRSTELGPRAAAWWRWGSYIGGSGVATAALVAALGAVGVAEAAQQHTRGAVASLALLTFLIGYLTFLWLVAFPVLDRYLLPVVPLIGMLVGRGASLACPAAARLLQRKRGIPESNRGLRLVASPRGAGLLLAALLIPSAVAAARSEVPVGGDHGAYDGIQQVAAYLGKQPWGTVIYYDTLGWTLAYYLFDSAVYLSPFASPSALAADLAAFAVPGEARYLALPGWESHTEILEAVLEAGCTYEGVMETHDRFGNRSFVVYRIQCP